MCNVYVFWSFVCRKRHSSVVTELMYGFCTKSGLLFLFAIYFVFYSSACCQIFCHVFFILGSSVFSPFFRPGLLLLYCCGDVSFCLMYVCLCIIRTSCQSTDQIVSKTTIDNSGHRWSFLLPTHTSSFHRSIKTQRKPIWREFQS